MNSEMIKFFFSSAVPSGFVDSEGEIKANTKMVDFLGLNKNAPEMVTLLEKTRTEKSPFFVIIKLVSDFKMVASDDDLSLLISTDITSTLFSQPFSPFYVTAF
ncbi:hypothetical protein [Arsenophonus sp. PmNCSU2021_1]|uniref:hypothetical protein n=1 Tax=Arsenophonus sp. PmNCSU2021_1 TaxID=3118989 RepID=UPI002FEFB561